MNSMDMGVMRGQALWDMGVMGGRPCASQLLHSLISHALHLNLGLSNLLPCLSNLFPHLYELIVILLLFLTFLPFLNSLLDPLLNDSLLFFSRDP